MLLPRRLPCSPICTRRPCSSTARLFCRVALCTCCALCAIKHMTQKHWCVRAAREREERVKTHSYAVLKGCRERDIVRPPTPVQITPELPTVTVFYSRVARNLVGSREKQCGDGGDDLNTAVGISLPRWSGNAVIVTALFRIESNVTIYWPGNQNNNSKLQCYKNRING